MRRASSFATSTSAFGSSFRSRELSFLNDYYIVCLATPNFFAWNLDLLAADSEYTIVAFFFKVRSAVGANLTPSDYDLTVRLRVRENLESS